MLFFEELLQSKPMHFDGFLWSIFAQDYIAKKRISETSYENRKNQSNPM